MKMCSVTVCEAASSTIVFKIPFLSENPFNLGKAISQSALKFRLPDPGSTLAVLYILFNVSSMWSQF